MSITMSLLLLITGGCSGPTRAEPEQKAGSPEIQQDSIPAVQVLTPRRGNLVRSITLPGSVEAFERTRLYAKVAGYMKEISVDIGDRVSKGQVLAVLDIPEMTLEYVQVEAELAEVKAQQAKAQADDGLQKAIFERSKTLRAREAITQQQFEEAQARCEVAVAEVTLARARIDNVQAHLGKLKTLLEYAKITAPFDGIVTERFVDPGALIQAATAASNVSPVVMVQRVDTVRVFIDVPEPDVPVVNQGVLATLTLSALPEKKFVGTVTRFASALDPSARTMRTEIDFPNSEGVLRPGMYGSVTLNLETRFEALTLPAPALVTEKGKTFVYIVEDGKARRVEVMTGIDDGIRVEIVKGLQGNEAVIVAGASAVSDGDAVRAVTADAA